MTYFFIFHAICRKLYGEYANFFFRTMVKLSSQRLTYKLRTEAYPYYRPACMNSFPY